MSVVHSQTEKLMLEYLIAFYSPIDVIALVKQYAWSMVKEEHVSTGEWPSLSGNFQEIARRHPWFVEWVKSQPDLDLKNENSPYYKMKRSGQSNEFIQHINTEWTSVGKTFNLPIHLNTYGSGNE